MDGYQLTGREYDEYFNVAFESLMKDEGGYVNDPNDPGGETKYGISKRGYPKLDIKNLSLEDAKKIYFEDFWLKQKCNVLSNYWLAEKIFNISVNVGLKKGSLIVQRALRATGKNVTRDGVIGPETINAISLSNEPALLAAIRSEAAGYYRTLVAANPDRKKFAAGWLNRAYA